MEMNFIGKGNHRLIHETAFSDPSFKAAKDTLDATYIGKQQDKIVLNGFYETHFAFTHEEIKSLLDSIVQSNPARAIKLFSELQADAQIALAENLAKEEQIKNPSESPESGNHI